MKHRTFLKATVLSLSESYAQCTGNAGIDTVLNNDNAAALLLIWKCCEAHQGRVQCGKYRVIHRICMYIFNCKGYNLFIVHFTFSGHITSIKHKTEMHTTLEFC